MRSNLRWSVVAVLALACSCASLKRQKQEKAMADRAVAAAESGVQAARQSGTAAYSPQAMREAENLLGASKDALRKRKYREAKSLAESAGSAAAKAKAQAEEARRKEREARTQAEEAQRTQTKRKANKAKGK